MSKLEANYSLNIVLICSICNDARNENSILHIKYYDVCAKRSLKSKIHSKFDKASCILKTPKTKNGIQTSHYEQQCFAE
jgi:hypothetical protein